MVAGGGVGWGWLVEVEEVQEKSKKGWLDVVGATQGRVVRCSFTRTVRNTFGGAR